MSQLVLTPYFPAGSPGAVAPEFDYLRAANGRQPEQHGRAIAALLPADAQRQAEVVLVLPGRAVSWHQVAVPVAVGRSLLGGRVDAARARAIVCGVLEEQLLEDPEQLHFAVFADPAGSDSGTTALWVAACARAPLRAALESLDAAGRSVTRVVAEYTPVVEGEATAWVTEGLEPAQMVLCTTRGVSSLPLGPEAVAFARAQGPLSLLAEPAVLGLAEHVFEQPAEAQTQALRVRAAAQSPWSLAQGEFSPSQGGRLARRISLATRVFLQAPAWRPVRWALVLALVVQLLALNVLAWQERQTLRDRRAAVQSVLTQTFSDIPVVVNAPLQMRRALDALARDRGVGSGPNLGGILAALGGVDPEVEVTAIDLEGASVRLHLANLPDKQVNRLIDGLATQGWRAQFKDDALQVQSRELD